MAGRNDATPLQDVLDRVVAEAEAAATELEVRRADLMEQLRVTNDELRRLTRVVNAAQPTEPKQRRKDLRTDRMPSVAPSRLEKIRTLIKQMPEPITAPDLAAFSKGEVNADQASKAFLVMRDAGEIRFTGYEPTSSGKGKGRKRYALVS